MSINGSDLEALLGGKLPLQTVTQISPIVWFHFRAHVCGLEERGGGGGKQKGRHQKSCDPNRTAKDVGNAIFLCGQGEERGLVSIWWSLCHSNSMPCFGVMKRQRLNDYHERSRYSRVDLRRKFVISIALLKTLIQACLVIIFYHRSIIQPKTAVLFFNLHHMHPVPHGNKMGGTVGDGQPLLPEVDTSL